MRMAEITGAHGGMVMSHVRSEDDAEIIESINELAALGIHAPVHISHLKVVYGKGESRAEEVLTHIDSLRQSGVKISADTYPYAASYTGIGIVFPEWAKTEAQWQQALTERPEVLRRALTEKVTRRNGPGAILFGSGAYAGKTLGEVAESKGITPIDLLMEMGPGGASAAHFVMDEALQDRIAVDPNVMICSDGSPSMWHPRGYGSFAKVIRRYVTEQQSLSLEEAVRKMSGLPAKTLSIKDRGIIAAGNKADLILFQPDKVGDLATFEEPQKLAVGMEWVWVNGKPAIREGRFSPEGFGVVLRKN
jgi:N-acyl-D-amino-acid deacylase